MRVLNFEGFVSLSESNGKLKAELIGDSSVGLYKALTNQIQISHPELNKVGISTIGLLDLLKGFSQIDPEVGLVFIGIGSNDLYQVNNQNVRAAASIRKELQRIFPNAEFVVVKGGWGWGGLDKFPEGQEPKEMDQYYKNVWERSGFNVMERSQGYSPQHHTTNNQEIRKQVSDMESIVQGNKNLYVVGSISDAEPTEEDLEEYFDALERSVNNRDTLSQQKPGTYSYDPLVQRIQIGLEFLGYDLPRFGADGLYGPETAESIKGFKLDNSIDTSESSFGPEDMIAFITALRENQFSPSDLKSVWKKSQELSGDIDLDDDSDYLYYMQHQQGPSGAASLIKASQGAGKLNPATRANSGKYLTGNMPDKEIAAQISAAIDANDDQRAATLFLSYWKNFWNKKKQRALNLINQSKYSDIKSAIDSVETSLPKDFLYTVAFIESGLQAKPSGTGKYMGLFAITQDSLNKRVPNGNIYNPKDNATAAIKGMEEGIGQFTKLAGNYLKKDQDFLA